MLLTYFRPQIQLLNKLKSIVFLVSTFSGLISLSSHSAMAISYSWNGTTSDWSTAANWFPIGVPAAGDDVTIAAKPANPSLGTHRTIRHLYITSGTLLTGGFTLTVAGNLSFTNGAISGGGLLQVSGASTAVFGATNGYADIDATLQCTSASLTMTNTQFRKEVTFTKTGHVTDYAKGNNRFYAKTTLINAATIAGGTGLVMAHVSGDTFDEDLYLIGEQLGAGFHLAWAGNTTFKGDIILDIVSGIVNIGNPSSIATLEAGYEIRIEKSKGNLYLRNFRQIGATQQNLVMKGLPGVNGGGGELHALNGTIFNGNVKIKAFRVNLTGCVFNRAVYIDRTIWQGATPTANENFESGLTAEQEDDVALLVEAYFNTQPSSNPSSASATNNIFNGPTLIRNSYSYGYNGNFIVGYGILKNIFNDELTLLNALGATMQLSPYGTGDVFNKDVKVNNFASGGITIGSAGASTVLAAGKTITVGNLGFAKGSLLLQNFSQVGNTSQTLSLTGTATLRINTGSSFGGEVNLTAPNLYLDGATYHKGGSFTKSATTWNSSLGGNVFKGKISLTSLSTINGHFNLATVNDDVIQGLTP